MTPKVSPAGWDPLPSAEWLVVVAFLESTGLPWPTALAAHDLRWHATMERRGGPSFPSRRRFMARWLWTGHAVRALLASESWRDPVQPPVARAVAQQSPNNRPAIAQQSPSAATANAENTGETAHVSPSNRPAIAQESPHARFPCSPITDHRTPDPSGGVASATEPAPAKPTRRPRVARDTDADAAAVYAAWYSGHPAARPEPTPDGQRAIERILAECGTAEHAAVYIAWVAESDDEAACRLRGVAPWPDGTTTRRDDLESLSRHIPARLPLAMAWDQRGRTGTPRQVRTAGSPGLDAWMAMLAGRWPTDGPAAAALRAIGGSSAVRARTSFDEPRLRDRFIATYDSQPKSP